MCHEPSVPSGMIPPTAIGEGLSMSSTAFKPTTSPLRLDVVRRRRRPRVWMAVVIVLASVAGGLWVVGARPTKLWSFTNVSYDTVRADKGDVPRYVVESGALESANNTTIKCKVEALMGLVAAATPGGPQQQGAGGNRGGAGGGAGKAATTPAPAPKSAAAATKTGAAATKTGTGAAAGAGATAGAAGAAGGAGGAAGATGAGGAAGAAPMGGATTAQRPQIQSFTMVVQPHVPLRPTASVATQAAANKAQQAVRVQQQQNAAGGMQERPGSTRILTILPEGQVVKAGDVVCTLDSAAFRDERAAQEIRYLQAKSWVDQAEKVLEVAEISLQEYREGIFPQDRLLTTQYIETCKTQLGGARDTYVQSRRIHAQGWISAQQLNADKLSLDRAEINLREAYGMRERLEKYTGPRLRKNLEAKIDSIRSDLYAQKAAFELENERLRRLNQNIANCEMKAPHDGIVVYASEGNRWGQTQNQIREGLTVREGQAIFALPDPKHMRVKAKINESKVSAVRPGQRASIRVDAFPNQPLTGTVAEVTPIPSQALGPFSDIKCYFATVDIDTGGFDGLRTGMSAEVGFELDGKHDVTRVPLDAVRWSDGSAYVAQPLPSGFVWRKIEVGIANPTHVEVISGLNPGESVIANPVTLPAPKRGSSIVTQTAYSATPRG